MKNAFVIGFRRIFSMHHAERLAALCLLLFTLAIGHAWGETSTLTFTAACGGSGTADNGASWTITSDAAESTFDATKGIHYGTSKKAVSYISLSTSSITGTITEIVVNASGASSTSAKLNIMVGGKAFGTEHSLTSSATNYTLTGSASGAIVVAITQSSAKKALYCKSITVTYTVAASCTTNPTVTEGSNSSVTSTTATVTCSSGISSLGSAGCSITDYGFVIGTSENPAIGGSGVTKHQVGTTYTSTGVSFHKDLTGLSAETTYYVRPYATNGNGTAYGTQTSFTTPALPKYTVTLKDNEATLTQTSYDAAVTLPSRTGCTGYTFAGWTKTWVAPQSSWTTTAPTIIPAGSYTPTDNENLYPVYTKEEAGGEPVETKTQTFQYDTWEHAGSSTDKSSYRLFHNGGYVESASNVDFSKLSKVIVYGGTFGGSSYNGISIRKADGTVWKNATVSGSSQTGVNTITGETALTGSAKLRVYSTSGSASGTGVRISKVEVFTMESGTTTSYISVPNCCTPLGAINGSFNGGTQKVTWEAVTDASGYKVKVEDSSHSTVTDWADIGDVHEYSTSNLTCGGVTYYVYVKAYNNNNAGHCPGDGPSSTAIEVATAACTAPAITVNPSSLTGLNYIVGAGPSAAQSFSMSGMNLTSETLTITAPTNFEVSLDNSNWGDSKTKSASGTLAATTVYVRLVAGKSAGEYSGNVTISGGGLASYVSVAVSGTVLQPALSVTPVSLSFGDVAVNSSKEMTFTLSGSNLKADATISVTGEGYSVSPTPVSKGSGTISSQTITVTYHPTTTGDNQAGTVTVRSTDAADKTVSLTGNSKATYSVSVSPTPSNGTVTSDKTSGIMAGETVMLTITPNIGYQLKSISATDVSSNDVNLTGSGTTRTFTMPASDVTVAASFMVRTDYVLVTDISQLADGDIITIATMKGNNEKGYILHDKQNDYRGIKSVTTTLDGKIADSYVEYPILLERIGVGSVWKLYDSKNDGYLYAHKGKNYLKTGKLAAYNHEWSIQIMATGDDLHKALIHQQACNSNNDCTGEGERYIEFNSDRWSGYLGSQTDGYIYKKELGCDRLPAPEGLTAASITQTTAALSWTAVANANGYEVSLDNGSTWTSAGTSTTYNATGLTAGTTYNWKVRATGTGDYCDKGTAAGSTVTMKKAVTVTYNSNGSTGGQLPVTGGVVNLTEGDSYTILGNVNNLTKSGYTFDGWHSSATYNATPAYTIGGSITVYANVILYANWKPKRDTFIDGVHGTAEQYGDGAGYTVPSCLDQSRATSGDCEQKHYKFIGWALFGADLTNPSNIFSGGGKRNADGKTYYAVWAAEE